MTPPPRLLQAATTSSFLQFGKINEEKVLTVEADSGIPARYTGCEFRCVVVQSCWEDISIVRDDIAALPSHLEAE